MLLRRRATAAARGEARCGRAGRLHDLFIVRRTGGCGRVRRARPRLIHAAPCCCRCGAGKYGHWLAGPVRAAPFLSRAPRPPDPCSAKSPFLRRRFPRSGLLLHLVCLSCAAALAASLPGTTAATSTTRGVIDPSAPSASSLRHARSTPRLPPLTTSSPRLPHACLLAPARNTRPPWPAGPPCSLRISGKNPPPLRATSAGVCRTPVRLLAGAQQSSSR